MADQKAGVFAKAISKQFIRTKAKVLQNLGKCDKTATDQTFEGYINNVHLQQTSATRLQKELKHYMTCVRALSAASHSLMEAINDTYEPEWVEHSTIKSSVESLDLLWGDLQQKLNEGLHTPLVTYLNNFHDVKQKIKKRERKMVDFDNARHNHAMLQSAKKRDEAKIAKAQEEHDEAKKIFDSLNAELHQELPDLYDRRVDFYVSSFQALFSAEQVFHHEVATVNSTLSKLVDRLSEENGRGAYKVARSKVESHSLSSQKSSASSNGPGDTHSVHSSASASSSNNKQEMDDNPEYSGIPEQDYEQMVMTQDEADSMPSDPQYQSTDSGVKSTPQYTQAVADKRTDGSDNDDENEYIYVSPTEVEDAAAAANNPGGDASIYTFPEADPSVYHTPENNAPIDDSLPAGVLYQVKATHDYKGNDDDELTFAAGDIIYVMPYDDPEDEDEGWLMGLLQTSGVKGVFPANFTKPI